MKKYIIKNCPAFTDDELRYGICYDDTEGIITKCKMRDDCLLKRIVNIVKDEALIGGINEVAENVLELLEIEGLNEN